jgi:hypothetical protein
MTTSFVSSPMPFLTNAPDAERFYQERHFNTRAGKDVGQRGRQPFDSFPADWDLN